MMPKSAAYSPLDGLVDLACRDGVEIRPTLLRVLTDLYVQKPSHSAEEEAQYVELSLRLIDAVDAATRSAVSTRLSTYANAPVAVLRRLIELSAPAMRTLPEQNSTQTTAGSPDLAEEFFAARADERRLILTNLEFVGQPVPRRAAATVSEVVRRLETAALQRNPGEFARVLERALDISHSIADRIVRDNSSEPLLVAAKVLGMPAPVFQRVLLFLNPSVGQSVERVFELSRLFEDIKPSAAERMVAIWRDAATSQTTVRAPVYTSKEPHSAHPSPASARHAAARPHEQKPRLKTSSR